jgi:hypothetical protein
MKITFNGHTQTQREIVLSQRQLDEIFELMKYELLQHIEFTSTFDRSYSYEDSGDKVIRKVCEAHDVDVAYKKDRMAFFAAVLSAMGNPYQQKE